MTAFLLLNCGGSNPPTKSDSDKTPPTLKATSPLNNATNVLRGAAISAVFSEPVDSMSISSGSFSVDGGVSGDFTFVGDTVRLTPSAILAYGTTYTASLTTSITDTAGNHLQSAYSWSFTTESDPATTPPVVVSTVPGNNSSDAVAIDPIRVTFSKELDSTTVTTSTITVDNGVTGTVTYSSKVATFTPSDTLAYDTRYTVTISTAIADTFGIHLAAPYQFSFTTQADPLIPLVYIDTPSDSAIVGDTAHITAFGTHPIGVARMELYVDDVHIVGADVSGALGAFDWDATSTEIGTPHRIYVKAYDADDRVGVSDTLILYHRWQTLENDINDPWPTDIKRVLGRSTDSLLELRYEFWGKWGDAFNDTSFDLGVYFDIDNFSQTGRTDFAGTPLNGIGADYRVIVGVHGNEAFAHYDTQLDTFLTDYGPNGFAYLNITDSSDFFEVGIRWSDLSNPGAVQFVSINVLLVDQVGSFIADWAPNQGNGYVEVLHSNRYIGPPYVPPPVAATPQAGALFKPSSLVPPNPFR